MEDLVTYLKHFDLASALAGMIRRASYLPVSYQVDEESTDTPIFTLLN